MDPKTTEECFKVIETSTLFSEIEYDEEEEIYKMKVTIEGTINSSNILYETRTTIPTGNLKIYDKKIIYYVGDDVIESTEIIYDEEGEPHPSYTYKYRKNKYYQGKYENNAITWQLINMASTSTAKFKYEDDFEIYTHIKMALNHILMNKYLEEKIPPMIDDLFKSHDINPTSTYAKNKKLQLIKDISLLLMYDEIAAFYDNPKEETQKVQALTPEKIVDRYTNDAQLKPYVLDILKHQINYIASLYDYKTYQDYMLDENVRAVTPLTNDTPDFEKYRGTPKRIFDLLFPDETADFSKLNVLYSFLPNNLTLPVLSKSSAIATLDVNKEIKNDEGKNPFDDMYKSCETYNTTNKAKIDSGLLKKLNFHKSEIIIFYYLMLVSVFNNVVLARNMYIKFIDVYFELQLEKYNLKRNVNGVIVSK